MTMVVVAAYMLVIPNEVNYQSIIKVINHHMIADSRMEEAFTAHIVVYRPTLMAKWYF